MAERMCDILRKWSASKNLVIIRGSGDTAFCAGGDIKALARCVHEPWGRKFYSDYIKVQCTLNYLIGNYGKPYVSLAHGLTLGMGVGISVHGTYCIATEKTLLALPETAIGLYPDSGATQILSHLRGHLGFYLGLIGHRLQGVDVKHAGIATHYVNSFKLEELTDALINSGGKDVKKILDNFEDKPPTEFSLAQYSEKIDQYFSAGTVEELIRRLKNDNSEWAQQVIDNLSRMSPTSLKITHKALQKGREMNLYECLKMETRLSNDLAECKAPDFLEGVRARLLDKDDRPNWNPWSLVEINENFIEGKFKLLPDDEEFNIAD